MGILYRLRKGSWKQLWCVLRHSVLYKYQDARKQHPYGFYDLRGGIAGKLDLLDLGIKESKVQKKTGGSYVFYINTKLQRFVFATESEEEMKKWISCFNKEKKYEKKEPQKVFGVCLQDVGDRDDSGVPLFLSALLNLLEATALDKDDLFAHAPDHTLKRKIDKGILDLTLVDNPHAVAGLIIDYLHELPENLIPEDHYEAFFGIWNLKKEEHRHHMIHHFFEALPPVNRSLLYKLFKFLNLASKKALDMDRLAKIFGRLVLRPKAEHEKEIVNNLAKDLILNYELTAPKANRHLQEEDSDSSSAENLGEIKNENQKEENKNVALMDHRKDSAPDPLTPKQQFLLDMKRVLPERG